MQGGAFLPSLLRNTTHYPPSFDLPRSERGTGDSHHHYHPYFTVWKHKTERRPIARFGVSRGHMLTLRRGHPLLAASETRLTWRGGVDLFLALLKTRSTRRGAIPDSLHRKPLVDMTRRGRPRPVENVHPWALPPRVFLPMEPIEIPTCTCEKPVLCHSLFIP